MRLEYWGKAPDNPQRCAVIDTWRPAEHDRVADIVAALEALGFGPADGFGDGLDHVFYTFAVEDREEYDDLRECYKEIKGGKHHD